MNSIRRGTIHKNCQVKWAHMATKQPTKCIRLVAPRHRCLCQKWGFNLKSKNQLETKQIWKSVNRARVNYWVIMYEMAPSHGFIGMHLAILRKIAINSISALYKLTAILILIRNWTKWLWHQTNLEVYAIKISKCNHKIQWASVRHQHSPHTFQSLFRRRLWCANQKTYQCSDIQICCMISILQTMGGLRQFFSEHLV